MHRQQGKSGFMDATPIAADVQLGFIIQQCTMFCQKSFISAVVVFNGCYVLLLPY